VTEEPRRSLPPEAERPPDADPAVAAALERLVPFDRTSRGDWAGVLRRAALASELASILPRAATARATAAPRAGVHPPIGPGRDGQGWGTRPIVHARARASIEREATGWGTRAL
jgi:hypothetical protein